MQCILGYLNLNPLYSCLIRTLCNKYCMCFTYSKKFFPKGFWKGTVALRGNPMYPTLTIYAKTCIGCLMKVVMVGAERADMEASLQDKQNLLIYSSAPNFDDSLFPLQRYLCAFCFFFFLTTSLTELKLNKNVQTHFVIT